MRQLPLDVAADFVADGEGKGVEQVDGHDFGALYAAVARAVSDGSRPCVVIVRAGPAASMAERLALNARSTRLA